MVTFGTVGVIVGLLAVAAAFIGVAVQLRENTRALQARNYERALERIAAIQARLAGDPELARIVSVGVREVATLTPEARIQLTWTFYEMFGAFELIFDQARSGTMPAEVWDRWSKTLSWWLSLPGVQAWWKAKPAPFSPRFTDCVDGRLAEPDVDPQAVARWQAFLWGADGDKARWHFGRGVRAEAPREERPLVPEEKEAAAEEKQAARA